MMQTNRTESVRQPNPMKVEVKCDPDARFGGSTSLKPRGCHRDRIKQEIVLPKLQCSESAELLQKLRGRYHVQPTINSLSLTNGMRRRLGEINGREQVEEVDTVQLRMRPPGSSPDLRSSVFRKRLSVRIPSNTVANLARKFNTMTVNQGVTQLKGRVGNENGGSRESTKVSNGPPTAHRGRWKLHGHWIDNEEGVVMDFDSLTRSKSYSCEKVDKEMTEGELGIQNDNRSMSFSTGDIFEFIELDETTSSLDLAETTPNHDALGTESTPIEVNTHIRSSESNPITNEPRLTARNVNFFNSKITSIVERNDELEIPIQPNTVRTESATSLDDDSFQDAFETLPPNIQTADETNLEAAVTNEARMIVDSDSESVTNTAASVKSKVGCPNDCHSSQDTISHEEGAMCSGVGPAPSATGDSVAVSHGDYLCEPLKSRSVSLEMTENSLDKNEKENTNKKRRNIHTKTKLNLKKRNNISFLWCCQKSMSKLLKNASDVDEVTSRSKNKRNPDNSSNYENSLSSNGLHLLPHSSLKSRSVEELTDKRKTVQIDGKLGEFHLDFSSESLEESIARSLKMLNFNGESLLFAGEKQDLCLESEEEERTSSGSREDVINDLSSDISYCADSETNDQPSHRPLSTVSSSASLKTNDSSNSSDRCERSHIETPLRPHRSAQPCSMSESSRHGVVIDPVSIYISTPSESSRNDALLDQRSSFDTKSLSQFQLQQDNPISSRDDGFFTREMMLYHQQTTKMSSSSALGARNFDGHPCKLFSTSKVVNDIHILPTVKPCFAEINTTEKPVPPPRPRRLSTKRISCLKLIAEDSPASLDILPQHKKSEESDDRGESQTELDNNVMKRTSMSKDDSVPAAATSQQNHVDPPEELDESSSAGANDNERPEDKHCITGSQTEQREPSTPGESHDNRHVNDIDNASSPPPLPPRASVQTNKPVKRSPGKGRRSMLAHYSRPNSYYGLVKESSSFLRRSLHLPPSEFSITFPWSNSQEQGEKCRVSSLEDSSTRDTAPEVSVSSTSSVICVNAEPVSDQSVGVCEELSDCDRTLAATATPLRHVHDEKEGGESQELSLWIGSEGAGSNPDVRYDSRSSTNDVRCESLSSTTDTISTVGSIKDVNESDGITEVVYKCSSECSEPEENIYEVIQCPDSQATPAPSNPPTAIVAASQPVHNPSALTSHRNSAPDVSQDKVLNTVGMKQKLKDNWNTTKQGLNRIRRRTLVPALADISKAIKVAASNSETNSSRDGDQRSSVPRPQPPITDTYSDSRGSSSERSAFYLDIARDLSSTCDQRCLFPVDDPIYNLAKCVEPLTQKFMYTGDRSSNGNSDASSDTIELVNDGADDIPTPVKADSDRLERVADDNTLTQNNSNGSGSTSSNSSRHSTSQFLGDLTNSNNVGLAGILSDSASSVHVHKTPTTLSGQSETHMELSVCLAAGSRESQNLQLSVLNSASTSHTALTSTPSAPDHSRASIISGCSSTHANFTISSSSDASSDAAYIAANSYLLNEEPLYQVYMRNPKGAIFDDESISSGSIYEEVGSLKSVPASNGPATKPVTPVIEVHQSDGQRSLWSHLPEVINSGVLDRLESDERRLQEAVFELISSEASYIRSLRLLVTHFANDPALRSQEDDNQQSTAVISKSDHDTLFSNSTKVLECSENFLAELQQCLHEDIMMKNVPAILEKHASNHFHSYVEYCAAQYLQDRKLEQLSESNQVFVEHLYRLESASCCQCLKLHSFLMLPMQRVTRLPLLVSATLCRLQETQPQFSGWQAAYTAVKQLAEKCNDEACRSQRLDELVSISNKFVFKNIKSFPLTNSDRSLVKKSTMIWSRTKVDDNKKTFGRKGTRHQMVNLFLFTDVLIITKKKSSDGLYTVLDYCPRSMLQMSEMDEKSDKFLLTLLCNHEEKTFELMLSCTAQSERLRWSEAISPSVDNDDSDETVYQSWDCPQVCVHTAYVARDGDELALDPGDVVKVLRKLPDGWLQGEKLIGSKNGWFPSSCCTEIVSEHTRARNLRQRYKLLRVTANYLEQQNRAAKSKQLRTK